MRYLYAGAPVALCALTALMLICLFVPPSACAEVVPVPLPESMPRSARCAAVADGVALEVVETAVNLNRRWESRPRTQTAPVAWVEAASFPVTVRVTLDDSYGEFTEATIRPLSLGIAPAVDGRDIVFTLDAPANLVLETGPADASRFDGALHLFAALADPNPPSPDDPDVVYFAPGEHIIRSTVLKSGQTAYLAPGAVVRGQIVSGGTDGVTVTGHGILDGSTYSRWDDVLVPLDFTDCTNLTVRGVTVLDPAAWTLNTYRCSDVLIEDVKIIGARSNSDGITTQSCERLTARGCFVRGWDDNLVVKGYDGDARDILFENCVLWTDLAQSCEIGYETRADVIERVTFQNITVLHNFHKPVMSIHNSDSALVADVRFRDIVVEDAQMGLGDGSPVLIELTTSKNTYSQTDTRGTILRVVFDGVTVLSGKDCGVKLLAASKEATIDQVTFTRFTILGKTVTSLDDLKFSMNKNKCGQFIAYVN